MPPVYDRWFLTKELVRLLNEWDPIGVFPFRGGPKDEYGYMADPILSILIEGKSKKELTKHLTIHLERYMGIDLKSQHCDPDKFAEKVIKWWKSYKNNQ